MTVTKMTHETLNHVLIPQKTKAVAQRGSVKKMFLNISQNSQETPLRSATFIIKSAGVLVSFFMEHPFGNCFLKNK